MSCRISAHGNLIIIHIFLERIRKKPSKSRVVCNHVCFYIFWKINCYFRWKKAQSCLKRQFRNWFIFLDSFCSTWPTNICRGASHSPHSKQQLFSIAFRYGAGMWLLQTITMLCTQFPALLCHNSHPENLGCWSSKASYCLQHGEKTFRYSQTTDFSEDVASSQNFPLLHSPMEMD